MTRPHIANEYYYKNRFYDNLVSLQKDQIVDLASGRLKTDNTKLVHTFNKISEQSTNENIGFLEVGKVGEPQTLVNDVYLDLINNNGKYKTATPSKLANGEITFDEANGKDSQITNFVENKIKPIKIAMLPNLKDNYPTKNELGYEMNPFSLPEYEWTSFGGTRYNNNNNKYIIIDPNNEQSTMTSNAAEEQLKQKFLNSFEVESKTVLKSDLIKNDNFSDFSTNINGYKVYQVTNDFLKTNYFLNEGAAIDWLLKEYEFAVNDIVIQKKVFTYEDKQFNSLAEYMNWVYQTARKE